MKKKLSLLINGLLMIMMFSSCSNSPATPTVETPEQAEQTAPETTDQVAPKPTEQSPIEPVGEILSLSEAQDLLINWCELNTITSLPDMDKQEEGTKLYGFLVDYSDRGVDWSGYTYCNAWVNSSTGMVSFEEAGYSEGNGPNLYANIPDSIFPVPFSDGVIIPYDWFSPPEYVWGVTYMYEDKSVMESYQTQLKAAGFIDQGAVQSVESLWQYKWDYDGATFTVEMYSEGEIFSMNMYINK